MLNIPEKLPDDELRVHTNAAFGVRVRVEVQEGPIAFHCTVDVKHRDVSGGARELGTRMAGDRHDNLGQDTQFVKLYPEEKVAEIQGDHRFFQCARCCTDDTWDAVEPVRQMIEAQGDDTRIPTELIPRCPHCGGEAFPWVRGYGNFLQGEKYEGEYRKVSDWLAAHAERRILLLELGVGRMTPMFIQEPFWNLTLSLPHARYVAVNDRYDLLPVQIADKGMVIVADIARVLADARALRDNC